MLYLDNKPKLNALVFSILLQDKINKIYGVYLEEFLLAVPNYGCIELFAIKVKDNFQGLGIGSEIIWYIVRECSKWQFILEVTPSSYWGSNLDRLVNYYKSFGFINSLDSNLFTTNTMVKEG